MNEELIPNAIVLFDISEQNLKNIIEFSKKKSLKIIEEEMTHVKEKLKSENNDIKKVAEKLQNNIAKIIK